MFDIVHKHKRIAQIVLALVLLPFAFFGIESYMQQGTSTVTVAKVGGGNISDQEFRQAMQEYQERIQSLMGGRAPVSLLEAPEARFNVLDGLIQRRVLEEKARGLKLKVADAQIREAIRATPAFQDEGKFSNARYEALLKAQRLTPVAFEAKIRGEMAVRILRGIYADSEFVPRAALERLLKLRTERREVSVAVWSPEAFLTAAQVEPGEVKAYYDSHPAEFQTPEQVRLEYVRLSAEELLSRVSVSPQEIKEFAAAQKPREAAEERRAAHILISVPQGAGAEAKAAARKQAEEIYREASRRPEAFADLAKARSQDPGSAGKGGDLGYFSREAMVKPFADAVFGMKKGEIAGPVESPFGFHVIRLADIRLAQVAGPEQRQADAEAEIKKQKAAKLFSEQAERLSNLAYEQSDSLKPAAEALQLPLQQSPWISRTGGKEAGALANPKLLEAVFSEDILKGGRNTDAVEVAPGVLVAARVVEHKAATLRPLEDVKGDIERRLARRQAAALAVKQGEAALAGLRRGETVKVDWSAARWISRDQQSGMEPEVLRQVFKGEDKKLPLYGGTVNAQGGFSVVRVSQVAEGQQTDAAQRRELAQLLRNAVIESSRAVYVAALKERADIQVNKGALERSER